MSIRLEESGRDIRSEVESLASERDSYRFRLALAEEKRRNAEAEASTLKGKLTFLAERDRKRIVEVRRFSERLTRERAALFEDRRRLRIEVEELREAKRKLLAKRKNRPLSVPTGAIRERRILDFLTRGGRTVTTARTGP